MTTLPASTAFPRLSSYAELPIAACAVEGRPVSANRMWRIAATRSRSGKRRMYLTDEAMAWEMAVLADAVSQIDTRLVAHARNLRIRCEFFGVRGDADNYLKATLDGLKKALRIDDRQFLVVESSVAPRAPRSPRGPRGRVKQRPGARIEIYGDVDEVHEPAAEFTLPDLPETSLAGYTAPEDERHAAAAPAHAPGSLRAGDLVDSDVRGRLLEPVRSVTIWPAAPYGALVIMIPPSAQLETEEWGAFVSLEHARQLRDRLNALPELGASETAAAGTVGTGGAA